MREGPDAWLCELTLQEGTSDKREAHAIQSSDEMPSRVVASDKEKAAPCSRRSRQKPAARASDQGYLPIELDKYLSLLDWTGRELRAGNQGLVPQQLSPILERVGLNAANWVKTARHFGR